MAKPTPDPEPASTPEGTPRPPSEGAFHQAFPGDPLLWHEGQFQECVPCLVASGLRAPEEPGPAPMPQYSHQGAAHAMAEMQGAAWGMQVHHTLKDRFRWQFDWTGPVPKFTLLILPADGRELDSSSIQELSWDMLPIDPEQVSGQGVD